MAWALSTRHFPRGEHSGDPDAARLRRGRRVRHGRVDRGRSYCAGEAGAEGGGVFSARSPVPASVVVIPAAGRHCVVRESPRVPCLGDDEDPTIEADEDGEGDEEYAGAGLVEE